jgi:hypothetical protein
MGARRGYPAARLAFTNGQLLLILSQFGAKMTGATANQTHGPGTEPAVTPGVDLFRQPPVIDAPEDRQQVADDSAAAMNRLRTPFSVDNGDTAGQA